MGFSVPAERKPPLPVRVVLADERAPYLGSGGAHIRLRRTQEPVRGGAGWEAVITLDPSTPLDPKDLLAHAHGFLVADAEGEVGVVEEVQPAQAHTDGTLSVGCGWFGRRLLAIPFEEVEEILPDEERLLLRPGLAAVKGARRPSNADKTGILGQVRGLLRRGLQRVVQAA
jgi:hypothetical protein